MQVAHSMPSVMRTSGFGPVKCLGTVAQPIASALQGQVIRRLNTGRGTLPVRSRWLDNPEPGDDYFNIGAGVLGRG